MAVLNSGTGPAQWVFQARVRSVLGRRIPDSIRNGSALDACRFKDAASTCQRYLAGDVPEWRAREALRTLEAAL